MSAVISTNDFFNYIATELEHLDSTMMNELKAYDPTLVDAASHLMKAGGKRLRPGMALLCSKATSDQPLERKHYLLAMALEVLHTATLIHDDILDGSETRRGLPTVNREWGQRISVLAGDFLLARSCFYISQIEAVRLNTIFSQMVMDMCNGEIQQFQRRYKSTLSMEEYLEQIERKTALLMAVGCQGAAIVNQADPEIEQAFYDYGRSVGMAFQIMDDILDFSISEQELGKSACNDLASGQVTLPTYYALKHSPDAEELRDIIEREMSQENDLERSIEIVKQSTALDDAMNLAKDYHQQALDTLRGLPQGEAKQSLEALAGAAIARRH